MTQQSVQSIVKVQAIKLIVRGIPGPPGGPTDPADFFRLNIAAGTPNPTFQGQFWWDPDEETISLRQNGAVLQLGQEQQWHIRNNTLSQIDDGTVVMATGAIGGSGRITGAPMDGTNPDNSRLILGIATEDIAISGDGKVSTFGKVRGIDTSGQNGETWSDGDILFISPTVIGGLTNVEPSAPDMSMPIAFVIKSNPSDGVLAVRATPINENLWADKDEVIDFKNPILLSFSGSSASVTVTNGKSYFASSSAPIDSEYGLSFNPANLVNGDFFHLQLNDSFTPDTIVLVSLNSVSSPVRIIAGGSLIIRLVDKGSSQFEVLAFGPGNSTDTTPTRTIDGAHTFTAADIGASSYINGNLTLPETTTEVIQENKTALFFNETDGDLTVLTEGQVRVDGAGVTLAARGVVAVIKDQHFDPLDTLTSGDTVADAIYRIEAQSLVDFTTIGAADNNVGTIFTSTGIVTMTAADSLTPAYDFTIFGRLS